VPITVILELAWVLQSFYEFSAQNLRAVLAAHADELVTFDDKKLARRAKRLGVLAHIRVLQNMEIRAYRIISVTNGAVVMVIQRLLKDTLNLAAAQRLSRS
jgi:hypothetical protein